MNEIMKIIKGILIGILIFCILVVCVILVFFKYLEYRNTHYYNYATIGGPIEEKFTALGEYDISYVEFDANNVTYKKFEIWYPAELETSSNVYPLVVMANGTGIKASQYKEVFQHLASWGFIVIGNEDENSRTGLSSSDSLDYMLALNNDKKSVFYGKLNVDKIGIGGHSQGGVGAINAVTNQHNGVYYKTLYTASTTSPYWGQKNIFGLEWSYDASKINIPYFMVAGTGFADAGTATDIIATDGQGICPLWGMEEIYAVLPTNISKVMARQVDKDHGDMLRSADAYMTAWFMYWLKDDLQASNVFLGDDAEILKNTNWKDVKTNNIMPSKIVSK